MSRVWFVTGSSRGLGRAIVERALERGDQVVASAREPGQLDDLVARHDGRVKAVSLDVTDAAQVERAVREGVEEFGRLDIVVNNAGYGDIAAVEDASLEDFRRQIDTNFYGVVYVTKAVLPILRKQGSGHIFQVSSLSSRIGGVGLAAYQSAKCAVVGFSAGVAPEVEPFGVSVTVLEPSGMATDWAGSSMTVPPVSEPYRQTVGTFAGMVREASGEEPLDVAEVAQVVADLAGRADLPLRLLLGADAVRYARDAAEQLAASDAEWRVVSESIVT